MSPRFKRKISKKVTKLAKRPKQAASKLRPRRAAKQPTVIPRITNETVAEQREEVLAGARKHIYPLSHSKHRVVFISTSLFLAAVIAFLVYCGLALYRFQSMSGFMYAVTKVIPAPVAKAGPNYVSYESYLFELRHYVHYYQTQQGVDFNSTSGKQQLASFKRQALQQVVQDAYVKQLAAKNHIGVSGQEVNDEVELVRSQNRLGSNDQVFRDVLQEFWGWSVDDFKRELKQQLLTQKVVAALDTGTQSRAQQALSQLRHGANFAKLAAKVSDDASTKHNGGEYAGQIDQNSRDVSPQVSAELFKLKPGHYSGVINAGYSLEIVKVISRHGSKVQAAHISFNFQSINAYLTPLKASEPTHRYIKV